MPTRLKRYYGRDHLHFLTCSCYHRQPWLAQPRRRDLFLEILEQVRQRYRFVVVGYVIMPEHIHLLISEPERGTPSTIMQVVKQRFARRVLRRKRRNPAQRELWPDPPHVWQHRFYDFNIWSERKHRETPLHAPQPCKARISSRTGAMASSYRSYAHQEAGKVKINQWPKAVMKVRPAA